MLQTGTHNLKSITEQIKKLNSHDLSYLQYYSQYCISQNKGRVDIARLILQYLNDIYILTLLKALLH